jgi:hypothetical protein
VGAKTCLLVYAAAGTALRDVLRAPPQLNREASAQLARTVFPHEPLQPQADGGLSDYPRSGECCVGSFGQVAIVAAREVAIDRPSQLPVRFLAAGRSGTITLHAMHSVVDWFAYARWVDGQLVRSLSVAPDGGVLEDIGARLPFEEPYWAGERRVEDYPMPFHPLELGEAALAALCGYELEGAAAGSPAQLLDPQTVPLMRYRRPWWGRLAAGLRRAWLG